MSKVCICDSFFISCYNLSNFIVKIYFQNKEKIFMNYTYTRVATHKQFRDDNGLNEQIEKLNAVGFDRLISEKLAKNLKNSREFLSPLSLVLFVKLKMKNF